MVRVHVPVRDGQYEETSGETVSLFSSRRNGCFVSRLDTQRGYVRPVITDPTYRRVEGEVPGRREKRNLASWNCQQNCRQKPTARHRRTRVRVHRAIASLLRRADAPQLYEVNLRREVHRPSLKSANAPDSSVSTDRAPGII